MRARHAAGLLYLSLSLSVKLVLRMVLTAKFGCARLYSRIVAADVDSRRLNLQACYAEYGHSSRIVEL